ncbi:MAG: diaminopimelate epimerase [Cytophagaceae bacterium]|jgi:diaminopimelate epimerase|nr:diaminopimelate epimerase [Cytophagaceae bacterium]
MKITFYKYQGTGNDFVLLDHRVPFFDKNNHALIEKICDRRFGIGADGFMLLENEPGYDFKMVYYNSDGKPSTMCGNGGRCIVKFAHDLGLASTNVSFVAVDGPHQAEVKGDWVYLQMIDVNGIEKGEDYCYLNTGSPHYVKSVHNIQALDVQGEGKKIRYNERFKAQGTNVNFIEAEQQRLWVRTYERGVEDETFSCGTGVTAAALTMAEQGWESPIAIRTKGGDLSVAFEKKGSGVYEQVYLNGPAKKVFEGTLDISLL